MATTTIAPCLRQGHRRQLLRELKAEIYERERSLRERDWEVRRYAAGLYFGDSVLRCGGWAGAFQSRFRFVLARGGDYTLVPCYDTLAAQVSREYTEYSGDDGCDRLWRFLLSPHQKMPSRAEVARAAEQQLRQLYDEEPAAEEPPSAEVVPACYAVVRDLAQARRNILLVGPTGCGKSYLAKLVAESLGLAFGAVNCTAGMSESHLLGRSMPNLATGGSVFHGTEFLRCYESGGVFLLDEIDAADSNVLLAINTAISNGYCNVPNRPEAPRATRHPDFILIATANTFGRGANRTYAGRNQLDEATLSRFRIGVVELDYSPEVEAALCPSDSLRADLVAIREKIRAAGLRRIMDSRFLADAHTMQVICGWSAGKILQQFFQGWSADELAQVT